ncbi:MAG: PAS domain-containing protein [Alphaproteobacteria bacterium]
MQGNEGDRTGRQNGGNSIELTSYRLSRNSNEMIHSEIRALYNYWERLRAGRPCPYRAEVDPRDMEGDAQNLFVLEDLGQGNLRFRLAGTALVDAFGYELRGMSARSVMEGKARESFVALIAETLAEPGVGYARLLAPDRVTVWEVVLLPLRGNFGEIDRLIGCLHPVSGRTPEAGAQPGDVPLRFTIDAMSIRPVIDGMNDGAGGGPDAGLESDQGDAMPLAGFGEGQASFERAPANGLIAIDGGLGEGKPKGGGERPKLRVVKTDD